MRHGLSLGLAIDEHLGGGDPGRAVALAGELGLDRVELDGRLIDGILGAPRPTVPIDPVPADALALGLLELEEDVLTDAYELARGSFDARLRAWRTGAAVELLVTLGAEARASGAGVDVLSLPASASGHEDNLDYFCRAGLALGARILAANATGHQPERVAAAAERFGLQPVIVAGPVADIRHVGRLLHDHPTLRLALDFVDVSEDEWAADQYLAAFADRLSYVRVGAPDAALAARLTGLRSDRGAPAVFVADTNAPAGTPSLIASLSTWRRLLCA